MVAYIYNLKHIIYTRILVILGVITDRKCTILYALRLFLTYIGLFRLSQKAILDVFSYLTCDLIQRVPQKIS
jgi:hypothetical protein